MLKKIIRQALKIVNINIRAAVTPGVSFFGFNFYLDKREGPEKPRSQYALEFALTLNPRNVLDVGSGGGQHAHAFHKHGSNVLCVDYGTSIYAQEKVDNGIEVVNVDFNTFKATEKFDLVWASHVLEHQRDIGSFIQRLIDCCARDGYVSITVPDPHRNLWGGHLSLWSPGLLAYNVVLCGVNLREAVFIRGTDEFSLFFKPVKVELPKDLTYDSGDLIKLSEYLPQGLTENIDPWSIKFS